MIAGQGRRVTHRANSETARRVREAVAAIYRLFESATPRVIEGCPCCISTRDTDVLLATPLRQISGQDLFRYVSGAFLTIGSVSDFRYLLPRILDVSLSDPGNANDPEIVLSKLPLADWRTWPVREQQAIEELIGAWFEHALEQDLADADMGWAGSSAESVLCGAARAGIPLERWLPRLTAPDAAPVLADMRSRYPGALSAFWECAPVGFVEVSTILAQGRA